MSIVDVPASAAGRTGMALARGFLGGTQDPHAPIETRRAGLAAFAAAAGDPEGVTTSEEVIGGVRVDRIAPPEAHGRLLYIHGGAYVLGSARTHRGMAAAFARASGATALAVDYRLAPEHPYPAAVSDVIAVWTAIADPAEPTIWVGDSAGGGLALAAAVAARDAGLPQPSALVLLNPWVDLTLAGDSHGTRAADEAMLTTEGLGIDAARYRGAVASADPRVSPLFARLDGLPDTFIQVGDSEILLDDAVRLHDRLASAGVDVTLERWEMMIHAWHAFGGFIPEAKLATATAAAFICRQFSRLH